MPSFYIDQHGCAKNQVDGEEIASRLLDAGYLQAPSPEQADVVIINTCGFIEDAKKESIHAVIDARRSWASKKIVVAGCLSQRYPQELFDDLTEADGIAGNADLSLLPSVIDRVLAGERVLVCPPQPTVMPAAHYHRSMLFDYPGTAHIKITEGCSNHCSYCAIPLIRGELRSRTIDDIVAEARSLLDRGVFEIVLIGQDLGNYGRDLEGRCMLADLLASLGAIDRDFRIRVMYLHPDHFPLDILPVMKRDPRIAHYFDIPFQHASAHVLQAMHRRGDRTQYLDLLARIRDALPDVMLRSTFLVGFPGETDSDFEELLAFQEQAKLDWLGAFTWSREEHTPAYAMKPRVPASVARQRKAHIEEMQQSITSAQLHRFVNVVDRFIVEEAFEHDDLCIARGYMQAPDVDGVTLIHASCTPGSVVTARIIAVNGVDFNARLEYTRSP